MNKTIAAITKNSIRVPLSEREGHTYVAVEGLRPKRKMRARWVIGGNRVKYRVFIRNVGNKNQFLNNFVHDQRVRMGMEVEMLAGLTRVPGFPRIFLSPRNWDFFEVRIENPHRQILE